MPTPATKRKAPARRKSTVKKTVKIQINAKTKPRVKGSFWNVCVNRVISSIARVVRPQ